MLYQTGISLCKPESLGQSDSRMVYSIKKIEKINQLIMFPFCRIAISSNYKNADMFY